jgi:hypothetical protein
MGAIIETRMRTPSGNWIIVRYSFEALTLWTNVGRLLSPSAIIQT